MIKKENTGSVKIIPLGGLEQIGMNMTAFMYEDEIVVVDCGLSFPDDDMLGVDLVIPDVTFLKDNIDKVKGFVVTHGHEDHIGAFPYVIKDVNKPIYATKLTMGIIETKFREHNLIATTKRKIVNYGQSIILGKFRIEFIRTNHSIADSAALAIHTPAGVIFHTGDFKVDYTPVFGEPIDLQRMGEIGKKGVLALLCDSTNVMRPGYTMSEKTVGKTFENIFDENKKNRIIVATFASNVDRVQQIINAACSHGRKVAVEGRSMVNIINVAGELGYIQIPDGTLIDTEEIKKYPDDQVTIITTGSQGESMSGLFRMANANHKLIIGKGDTVIISASAIPGNEKSVGRVINQLFQRGANVVYDRLADVHVSGHARREELKLMFRLLKPKYFIPVHGETRHLYRNAQLAEEMGIDPSHIFMMDNGNVLELGKRSAKLNGTVPSGAILIDGLGVGDIGAAVLRERRLLSQDGLFSIIVPVQKSTGELLGIPEIITRGFVYIKDSDELIAEAKEFAFDLASKLAEKQSRKSDWTGFKASMKSGMKSFLLSKTKRTPIILPIVVEIDC